MSLEYNSKKKGMYWLQKIQIVLILAVILSEYFSLEKNIDGKKKENKEAECF